MLEQITDCRLLEPIQNKLLKTGAVTNGLPSREALDREARAGALWAGEFPQGLLIFRRREGFWLLNFMLARGEEFPAWEPEGRTVVEMPFRPGDRALQALDESLGRRGFDLELSRVRLTRRPGAPTEHPGDIAPAGPEALEEVQAVLEGCFSPLTGCLPRREELLAALDAGQILSCPSGILHYNGRGRGTEIRHLAVKEACRGKGAGKRLLAAYLSRYGGQSSRVWTGADNAAALHLYHSFDYTEDSWRSNVRVYGKG